MARQNLLSFHTLSGPWVAAALKFRPLQTDLQTGLVVLEVTEAMLVRAEEVRSQIPAPRTMRGRIAMGDFGTGYSELPALKIDRAFVDTSGTVAAGR